VVDSVDLCRLVQTHIDSRVYESMSFFFLFLTMINVLDSDELSKVQSECSNGVVLGP